MEKSIGSSNEAEVSHILGIDYCKSKIGLAIADSETRMAFAFDTLKNDKDFFKKMGEIIEKENVKTIIVGILTYNNYYHSELDSESGFRVKPGMTGYKAREFGEKIEKEFIFII